MSSSTSFTALNPFPVAGDYKTSARARRPPPARSEPHGTNFRETFLNDQGGHEQGACGGVN
eukprot:5269587-Prymnesium_polylepis.1